MNPLDRVTLADHFEGWFREIILPQLPNAGPELKSLLKTAFRSGACAAHLEIGKAGKLEGDAQIARMARIQSEIFMEPIRPSMKVLLPPQDRTEQN